MCYTIGEPMSACNTSLKPRFCQGLLLDEMCDSASLPRFGQPFVAHYPFACHTSTTPWTVPTLNGQVFALECAKRDRLFLDPKETDDSCPPCSILRKSNLLERLLARQADPNTPAMSHHAKNLLSHSQMVQRHSVHMRRESLCRVKLWDQRRQINRLMEPIASSKQMVALLAENNVAHTREFFLRMKSRGASPKKIVEQVTLAISGKYKPRASPREDDLDKAEHALILGGPKLLYALQKTDGFLCQRTVMTMRERPRFIVSWGPGILPETVDLNITRFALAKTPKYIRAAFTLMVDDVAIEPRRRSSPNDL